MYIQQPLPSLHELGPVVGFDTETYDPYLTTEGPGFLRGRGSYMIGFSLTWGTETDLKSAYYPVRHNTPGNIEWDWKAFLFDLSRSGKTIIFAHAKYDLEVIHNEHIDFVHFDKGQCILKDIQTIDALIDENNESFSLAKIAERRKLPKKGTAEIEEELVKRGFVNRGKPDWTRLKDLPVSVVGAYAADDSKLTTMAYYQQMKEISRDDLSRVEILESELIEVFWAMRRDGVPVDVDKADKLNSDLGIALEDEFASICADANITLDPWSPKDLGAFVTGLGFKPPKTAKGNDSIGNEWLFATEHPLLIRLAKFRQGEKARRDFIEGAVLSHSINGRVHPQWFSTRGGSFMSGDDSNGTRSGRPACTDPNLAQIPARNKIYGPMIRGLFIPGKGKQWGKFDYSTQEPRITVHFAYKLKLQGAAEMRQEFINNPEKDYHMATAELIFKMTGTKIERDPAKTINLSLVYGMGKRKLATRLKLELAMATILIEAYFQGMPFVKELLDECSQIAQDRGYVRTILGRRRHFEDWESANYNEWAPPVKDKRLALAKWGRVRRANTYKALNSVVQGSAAEQTKTAMVQLYKSHKLIPFAQLYDELDYGISEPEQCDIIKYAMENAIPFEVPSLVKPELRPTWFK